MAARVPALRLAKGGAKRSPGRKSTPAGTLRELPVTSYGRGQERKRTPRGLQRGPVSCRNGSKKLHAPKPRAGLRSLSASEGRTTEGDSAAAPSGFVRQGRPRVHARASSPTTVRTGEVGVPGPHRRPRHAIPQHRAVGLPFLWLGIWSGGSQLEPIRRNKQRNQFGAIASWRFKTTRAPRKPMSPYPSVQ